MSHNAIGLYKKWVRDSLPLDPLLGANKIVQDLMHEILWWWRDNWPESASSAHISTHATRLHPSHLPSLEYTGFFGLDVGCLTGSGWWQRHWNDLSSLLVRRKTAPRLSLRVGASAATNESRRDGRPVAAS